MVGILTTYKYYKQARYSATSTTVSYSVAYRTRGLITSKRIQPSVHQLRFVRFLRHSGLANPC